MATQVSARARAGIRFGRGRRCVCLLDASEEAGLLGPAATGPGKWRDMEAALEGGGARRMPGRGGSQAARGSDQVG